MKDLHNTAFCLSMVHASNWIVDEPPPPPPTAIDIASQLCCARIAIAHWHKPFSILATLSTFDGSGPEREGTTSYRSNVEWLID